MNLHPHELLELLSRQSTDLRFDADMLNHTLRGVITIPLAVLYSVGRSERDTAAVKQFALK